MVDLPGYTLEVSLTETPTSTLYRGVRNSDGRRVVAKVLRDEHPSPTELARLRHEHALLIALDVDEVVKTLGLVPARNRLALILDDLGEGCVAELIGRRPEPQEFLRLALAMSQSLEAVHRHGIVHGDIKPHHFFRSPDGATTRLIDFGIARRMSVETDRNANPRHLEGTLAYISPEQTGRMNRAVDNRSDQYSLGVSFYQLLAGALPFDSTDPLELVHCHLARPPRDLRSARPDLPEALCAVVMKLLSKVPEDRYNSVSGLIADLAFCREELEGGRELRPFKLGRHDASDELRLPQALYGRQEALNELLAAFTRVQGGAPEVMLIAGYSGVGKSALVHQLQQAVSRRGRFVAGKFEQLNRNVPYSAIVQALRELMRGLLTESSAVVDGWKQKLSTALGANAPLLAGLVPELAFLPEAQLPAAAMSPEEAPHRFELAFKQFLGAFGGESGQPLVIFLDDLQWADHASLRMLQWIQNKGHASHVLILGAFRDNEVGPTHPLTLAMADLRTAGVGLREIKLGSLGRDDVGQFVADMLHAPTEAVAHLAEVLVDKTGGNPFFLGQFLLRLHRDGLVSFDASTRAWTWDIGRIRRASASDNVVTFMVERLRELRSESRAVLELAACIGSRFDRQTLASIAELPAARVAAALWDTLRAGLVVPLDGHHVESADAGADGELDHLNASYRFLHDRVQQAAYELVDVARREQAHLKLGRLMLERYEREPGSEQLAIVVGHLNTGSPAMTDAGERQRLARLNWQTGMKARAAGAVGIAGSHLGTALALLGEEGWQTDYETASTSSLAGAESAFSMGQPEEAFQLLDSLERHARSALDRAAGRGLRTIILGQLNRLPEALACVIEAARLLGHDLPSEPAAIHAAIPVAFGEVQLARRGRSVDELLELPADPSPEHRAWSQLVYRAVPVVLQTNPELLALMVLKATRVALVDGHTPHSPFVFAQYGLVHHVATGDYEEAYRLGKLAVTLAQRASNRAMEAVASFNFATFISHWRAPVAEAVECLRRSLTYCVEAGQQFEAEYAAAFSVVHRFHSGELLETVGADLGMLMALSLDKKGTVIGKIFFGLFAQVLANLRGQTKDICTLDSDGNPAAGIPPFNEAGFAEAIKPSHALTAHYRAVKVMILFLAGDFAGARAQATGVVAPPGELIGTRLVFFGALAAAAELRALDAASAAPLVEIVRRAESDFRRWAENCPENHGTHHAMLAAELAAATGAVDAAHSHYEKAINLAQARDSFCDLAIANEIYARFHLHAQRPSVARVYLEEASYDYQRWGAESKVTQLAAAYPKLLSTNQRNRARPVGTYDTFSSVHSPGPSRTQTMDSLGGTNTDNSAAAGQLDLLTAVRATQAIASELDLEKLLERLIRIMVTDAGAQRGFLVLASTERLQIAARATVEPDLVEGGLTDDLEAADYLAVSVVQYVARTQETVVLGDASVAERFGHDAYIQREQPRSLLCLPLKRQGVVTGVLYLENNATTDAFRRDRVELLQFLAVQAAISVDNAKLYGEVRAATEELRRANETLEQRVKDRTQELAARNAALSLVLDNVDQGLLTVAVDGRLSPERSAIVDSWFGGYQGQPLVGDYLSGADPRFATSLRLGLELLAENLMPQDLCIEQLPKKMVRGDQHFECRYLPIAEGSQPGALLMVVDDVTIELLHAREEAGQRELLAVFTAITRDRNGFLQFWNEAADLMVAIGETARDAHERRRALHTLKGNSGMMSLDVLAGLCHRAESELDEAGDVAAETLEAIRARWSAIGETKATVLGARSERMLEVGLDTIRALAAEVRAGQPAAQLLRQLDAWCAESVAIPLGRLARHAEALAVRLDKPALRVDVQGGDLLLDPDAWASLWSVLVHVVRNAVDHGVEAPDERRDAGKPAEARLRLAACQESGRLVLEIEDDGRGIDWDRLREVASSRGLAATTEKDLIEALMAPSVSTREEITDTSGRGVGMSAVREAVHELSGTIDVTSKPGQGTCWRFTFPPGTPLSRVA